MKIYRNHRCESQHRTAVTFLKCAIRRLEWVHGTGDLALIAWCKVPTITLYEATDHALAAKEMIDATGCGGRCHGDHEIVYISTNPAPRGKR